MGLCKAQVGGLVPHMSRQPAPALAPPQPCRPAPTRASLQLPSRHGGGSARPAPAPQTPPRPFTPPLPPAPCRPQLQVRNFEGARQACQAVINMDAGNHEAHVIRARTHMAQEQWEEAVNAARDSIQHHQQSQELHGVGGGAAAPHEVLELQQAAVAPLEAPCRRPAAGLRRYAVLLAARHRHQITHEAGAPQAAWPGSRRLPLASRRLPPPAPCRRRAADHARGPEAPQDGQPKGLLQDPGRVQRRRRQGDQEELQAAGNEVAPGQVGCSRLAGRWAAAAPCADAAPGPRSGLAAWRQRRAGAAVQPSPDHPPPPPLSLPPAGPRTARRPRSSSSSSRTSPRRARCCRTRTSARRTTGATTWRT
jgi:hypothetical protein